MMIFEAPRVELALKYSIAYVISRLNTGEVETISVCALAERCMLVYTQHINFDS